MQSIKSDLKQRKVAWFTIKELSQSKFGSGSMIQTGRIGVEARVGGIISNHHGGLTKMKDDTIKDQSVL